jgi:uncharacterized protein YceK
VPNVPSSLLGASARTARAAGCASIITYTLESESGDSLRAAGWTQEKAGITSWWTHPSGAADGRVVKPRAHYAETKVRWTRRWSHPGVEPVWPPAAAPESAQVDMFEGTA